MYFDDSHTEVKVTDLTHCDLETKSILKPPKARAPLQEVDLGNHITVEFDVIRKRRVSFAGVNKIKEFNSEAKSFSICSTPAYEEKVSTSSDSSALSTSVSGNVNSLTKENDITILDDTMDLTDLSIVQASAMDITGIKPQKPLQGVSDIFAPRSQDSGLFSNQGINRPIFSCEINNPTVNDGLEPNPLQTKSEKSNVPEDTPLVLDPRKMLLNELLEESAVDCSVDKYLKANILFAQNACNAIESKCEIKKSLLDVSEMDFTQALAEPIKPASHHVQPVLEKKDLASEPVHAKVISNNPSNLFGSLGMDMEQFSKLQNNALEMEYSKPSQKPRKSNMFLNFNNDENQSMKMDASQMEFTEALPAKNFNEVQNNLVSSNYIKDRLLSMPNSSYMDEIRTEQNPVVPDQGHVNFNYIESKLGNSNMSQMEFTEALPSKYKNVEARNYLGNIKLTEHSKPSQNNMIPNLNINESRIAKTSDVSQMEFTEALPPKNMMTQTLIADVRRTDYLSPIEQIKPFQKSIPNHNIPNSNVGGSRTETTNVSQMEFTEALPSKIIIHEHLVPNINIDESRRENANISQMEFTEVLPSKKIDCQALVPNIHNTASDHTKPFKKSTPSQVVTNIDESRSTKSNNASQMEFTEALPSKNLAPYNYNINEFGLLKSNNETQMELTEVIPSQKVNLVVNNVTINYIGERLLNRPNKSNLMADRQFHNIQNDMFFNSNIENSRSLEKNNVPEIKSIGAQSSPDVEIPFNAVANNMLISSNVSQKVQPDPRKSSLSETNNISQMEFTEALPSKKLPYNDIVTGNNAENRLIAHSNISPIEEPKINLNSENLVSNNYLLNQAKGTFADGTEKLDLSQMELTEAVPLHKINKKQSISNFTGKSSDIHRDTSRKNVIIDRENIPPSQDLNESNSMDVTELNFAEPEIGTYNVNTESNPMININSQVNLSKPACMKLINEGDISNMEFTEGLPMNVLNRVGKTEQKIIKSNETKKNPAFAASAVDNILENSSCMEFTSAIPQLKQSDNNVKSAIQNVDSKVKDEVPNRPNIFNSMGITEIDQDGCGGNMKKNRNEVYNINKLTVQPTFNTEQTISKDISLMEFTEALPGRNIQADPAKQLNCENNSKTVKNDVLSPNYNLQTSNMEFTEVLPMFKSKQALIKSKGVHEDISPSHNILLAKDAPSENNMNDSRSMDVTDVENLPYHEPFKNLKETIELKREFDKNQVNVISSDFSDTPKSEINEKLDHDNKKNPQNLPLLSGSQNNTAMDRKTSYDLQSGFSQLEFTEAVPIRNQLFTEKIAQDVFSSENKEQNIMLPRENDLLGTSNMEFTEFLQKPDAQQFYFQFENQDKGSKKEEYEFLNKVTLPVTKENFDKLSIENLVRTESIEHDTVEKIDEINVQDNYNKQLSNNLVVQENKPRMKFSPNLEQGTSKTFTLPSRPHENMFPVVHQLFNSSVDTTQMDFTEAVQSQVHLNEKKSGALIDLEIVENKLPDASQMEFTEAITRQKYQSELYQDAKDTEVNNFANENSISRSKELLQPNVETILDYLPLPQSNKLENISSHEKESQIKNFINEDVKIAEQNQKLEKACFNVYSQSKSSEEGVILNSLPQIFQNVNALGIKLQRPLQKSVEISNTDKDSVTIKISDKDNSQELNAFKNESVSMDQNLEDVTPMFVDEPSTPSIEKKESKVNSLRKIFENNSKSDHYNTDINTPKCKQFLAVRSAEDNSCESSNKYIGNSTSAFDVKTLAVDHACQKKNLVHFNTPPVRIIKRRKTLGPLNPEESIQLLQSSTSDLAIPLQDVSNMQNASQRRGIFEEEKKSAYNPEKGNEEWNRLVKNDAFMKERSFEFISPCKWKHKFRWPMELVLEIPDVEVSENSRRKNISLVSNINESDHISVFIDNRMKKNMSVILSEKWLNSHCKTIKDLLFTINFVEEEYNKLEPLINSMRYFYQEFPYDFSSDRIIFKIVNLRKEFCFEVKIDVSYGQVKGKNIDVINHVGQISKTKVQQLFDQLQPNRERFYLFWQKLMEIN